MKIFLRIVKYFYRQLLNFYPAAFREAFADEMYTVFCEAVAESERDGLIAMLEFCLLEFITFPASIIREQLAAYQNRQLLMTDERLMMQLPQTTIRMQRLCITSILILTVAFSLCIVLPFFAFGLHSEPAAQVALGAYDPKCYHFYQTAFGQLSRLAGLLLILSIPFWATTSGTILAFLLFGNWYRWQPSWRRISAVAFVISISFHLFLLSDAGRVIVAWYLD